MNAGGRLRLFAASATVFIPCVARADNCGGLSDCYGTIAAAVAVAAAIAAVILVIAFLPEILAGVGIEGGLGLAGVEGLEGVGAAIEGAGPWVAEASNLTEGAALAQSTAGSCVSACGEILSEGAMSEAEFLAQLGEWSNPGELAEVLNSVEGAGTWQGGYFANAESAVAAAEQGQVGAVLQAPGLPGHMVVINPGEAGTFIVQDPAIGATYEVTADWIAKWVSGGVF